MKHSPPSIQPFLLPFTVRMRGTSCHSHHPLHLHLTPITLCPVEYAPFSRTTGLRSLLSTLSHLPFLSLSLFLSIFPWARVHCSESESMLWETGKKKTTSPLSNSYISPDPLLGSERHEEVSAAPGDISSG